MTKLNLGPFGPKADALATEPSQLRLAGILDVTVNMPHNLRVRKEGLENVRHLINFICVTVFS